MDRAQVEHGLGTRDFPAHARAFQAVFDQLSAGTFDHSRGDGVARGWRDEKLALFLFAVMN